MLNNEVFMEAAFKFGTPFYLFDLDELKARYIWLREHLGSRIKLCYAMKANPFLAGFMEDLTDRIEVCSHGEFLICREQGIPADKLILSGILKKEQELLQVCKRRELPVFTAESAGQFELLCHLAAKSNRQLRVLLRLTSGNQFGMDLSMAEELIAKAARRTQIKIIGLHYFSGTQKTDPERIAQELLLLDHTYQNIERKYGIILEHMEYGPGIYVEYFKNQKPWEESKMLQKLRECVESMHFKGTFMLEAGRLLAAFCGYYGTTIQELKQNHGTRYALVDGGIHHLHYDGQMAGMKIPFFRQLPERQKGSEKGWNLCGALCTANDILVRNVLLRDVRPGDLLVFERAGAYSMTEGMSLFLSRDLPAVAAYQKEKGISVMRRAFPVYKLNQITHYRGERRRRNSMKALIKILEQLGPGIDYENCQSLIDDHILESFMLLELVAEIEDQFEIRISPKEIKAENFNSAKAMWEMIQRTKRAR